MSITAPALAVAFSGLTATFGVAAPAAAAPGAAFDCTVPGFFAQAEEPVGTVKVFNGSYDVDGDSVWTQLGANFTGANVFNAMAFNPQDKFLYGTYYGQNSGNNIRGSFVRIDSEGNLTSLGESSSALGAPPNTLWDTGEFDTAGNYYVASGNAGTSTIYKISGLKDVTSRTSTPRPVRSTIALSQSVRIADLTFVDGFLWAANYGESSTLYRINASTGQVTPFTLPSSVMPRNSYGSAFTMTNGNLALIATNGHMYQIAIDDAATASPTFTLITDVGAPENQRSNATNCASALPSSLSVEKTGPDTVVIGHTITWKIVVTNDGPGITSGFVLRDTLPNDLADVTATSDDTSCVVTGTTNKVATCNGGRLDVGKTAVVYVSATAPMTPGPLINHAQAIGNEDPDPDPPATSETEVVLGTEVNVPTTLEDDSFDHYEVDPLHGTMAYEDGVFTYTPAPGYSGPDLFSYRTSDGDLVTVKITVTPTADPDEYDTTIGEPVIIPGSALLALGDGSGLELTSVQGATHGTVSMDPGTHEVTFQPAAGFSGTATFTYTLTDSSDQTATATITINVPNVFTDGVAADGVTTPQNDPIDIPLDDIVTTDGELIDPTKITVDGDGPEHGEVDIDPTDGTVTYTPDDGYSGDDEFDLELCDANGECETVTIPVTVEVNTVTAVNDSDSTDAGVAVTVDVLDNDSSASGQPLGTPTLPVALLQPAHGTVSVVTGGIRYTPEDDFSGTDSFVYEVCDTSTPTPVCDTATVTITVANVFTDGPAVEDGVSTPQNEPIDIPVDDIVTTDGEPIDPSKVTVDGDGPDHGTVDIDPDTGDVTYTPDDGYSGDDEFDLELCDANGECTTVTIEVEVSANAVAAGDDSDSTPMATPVTVDVLDNDTSASGRPLGTPVVTTAPGHGSTKVESDGQITYTPAAGFSGQDSLVYTVCDTSTPTPVCDTATVTITVTNVFTPGPAAGGGGTGGGSGGGSGSGGGDQDTPVEIPLEEIVAPGGSPLDPGSVEVTDGPDHGTVDIDPDTGDVTYTPEDGYSGDDEFELQICDTSVPPQCIKQVIPVKVASNVVTTGDDHVTTGYGEAVVIDVGANDTSKSGRPLSVPTITVQPGHGTLQVFTDGRVQYTPDAGFAGTDSFEYERCDDSHPTQVCDTATVTVRVMSLAQTGVRDVVPAGLLGVGAAFLGLVLLLVARRRRA